MLRLRKPRVYIAHPITSSGHMIQNIKKATEVWRILIDCGYVPYCPGIVDYGANMGTRPMSYEEWMSYDRVWQGLCDVTFRMDGPSAGGDREVRWARRNGHPAFTQFHNLEKWKKEVFYPGLKSTSKKATQSSRSKKAGRSRLSSGRSTKKKGRR